MTKQSPTPTPVTPVPDKPLSQLESRWLAEVMRQRGVAVKDGLMFARLRPTVISKRFDIDLPELMQAIRRST